jgi:hypothetical protein
VRPIGRLTVQPWPLCSGKSFGRGGRPYRRPHGSSIHGVGLGGGGDLVTAQPWPLCLGKSFDRGGRPYRRPHGSSIHGVGLGGGGDLVTARLIQLDRPEPGHSPSVARRRRLRKRLRFQLSSGGRTDRSRERTGGDEHPFFLRTKTITLIDPVFVTYENVFFNVPRFCDHHDLKPYY